MSVSLATSQSGIGPSLMGEDPGPSNPAAAGFRPVAAVRPSSSKERTPIDPHMVLALVRDTERRRLVAEYAEQGVGPATVPFTAKPAFLEFLARRLPEPSHALSLCQTGLALIRARLGGEPPAASVSQDFWRSVDRGTCGPVEREIRDRVASEAWDCIERVVRGRTENDNWDPIERDIWECVEIDVSTCVDPNLWQGIGRDAQARIECEAWDCIERAGRGRIERAPHASLVWFHADPDAVLRTVDGAPPPPLGEPAWPLLFAPGLANLYRAATEAEAALWARLPADDAPPELVERLLADRVVRYEA